MTTESAHLAALRLVIEQAERRALEARAGVLGAHPIAARHAIDDLHAAIHGDLCDALDRIQPQLGTRLFTALHGDVAITGAAA